VRFAVHETADLEIADARWVGQSTSQHAAQTIMTVGGEEGRGGGRGTAQNEINIIKGF
jgi:hypothetical protein